VAVTPLPPLPPFPPAAATFTLLDASPVLPDWALETEDAPELAAEIAVPLALALPVRPVFPLSPECAEASTFTLPLIAVLLAETCDEAAPVLPLSPEFPDVADGLETDVDEAAPVLPVLVADDWAVVAPESPDVATGLTSTWTEPPPPPSAEAEAMESPPLALIVAAPDGTVLNESRLIVPASPTITAIRDLRSMCPPLRHRSCDRLGP
jgi:hypothetical protein